MEAEEHLQPRHEKQGAVLRREVQDPSAPAIIPHQALRSRRPAGGEAAAAKFYADESIWGALVHPARSWELSLASLTCKLKTQVKVKFFPSLCRKMQKSVENNPIFHILPNIH